MAEEKNQFGLWDTKEREWVDRRKEYKSEPSANRVAERKNQDYGANRYSARRYSDVDRIEAEKLQSVLKNEAERNQREVERKNEWNKSRVGGGSGGVSDTREMQAGSDLDPKAMMKREGYAKGGKVKSASSRADGCAIRGKTRA